MATATAETPVVDAEIVTSADAGVEEGAVASAGATDVVAVIQGLNTPGAAFYSSIKGADFATRLKLAAALTSSEPIDEHLNEDLDLSNIIVMPVDLADDDGNINTAARVILITEDGKGYHATSTGLLSAVRNLLATVGEPETWDAAIKVRVVEQKGRNKFKFFTIKLV